MLTADLVRVRVRGGVLHPQYIPADDAELTGLATAMIEIFKEHVGRTRRELDSELKDFLGTGTAFLLHRGLAKLLLDRCTFVTDSKIEPSTLREAVFAHAASLYQGTSALHLPRGDVIRSVCAELDLPEETFEGQLYADLKSEQVLEKFKGRTPGWLLDRYNVALAQAVLLRATHLDVTIAGQTPARYRELFRKMKFFRLLHEIKPLPSQGYRIRLDGPLSLFKSSQKYGIQMALFLPSLIHCTNWKLEATVRWGKRPRELRFLLDQKRGLKPIGHSSGQWQPEELGWFEEQFTKLGTDWELSADAGLVDLGGQGVLTSDYTFTHPESGLEVHMEILGFWRRGSVESRLELLRRHGPRNMILAVSRELRVDEKGTADLPGELYTFRTVPVARDVHKCLERIRETLRKE